MGDRSERLLLIVVPAAVLAGADLVVKTTVGTALWDFHQRSPAWVALSAVLLVGALPLALVPSRAVALAAGVMSAGVLGNLVSARLDGNKVPNPFLIGDYTNGFAFNLADVFFVVGNLLLMAALISTTLRNRERLIPPRQWERALRRRLRS
jgi:lipoprotein signal peptidase